MSQLSSEIVEIAIRTISVAISLTSARRRAVLEIDDKAVRQNGSISKVRVLVRVGPKRKETCVSSEMGAVGSG